MFVQKTWTSTGGAFSDVFADFIWVEKRGIFMEIMTILHETLHYWNYHLSLAITHQHRSKLRKYIDEEIIHFIQYKIIGKIWNYYTKRRWQKRQLKDNIH